MTETTCAACAEKRQVMKSFIEEQMSHARSFERYFNSPERGGDDPVGNAELVAEIQHWIGYLEEATRQVKEGAGHD